MPSAAAETRTATPATVAASSLTATPAVESTPPTLTVAIPTEPIVHTSRVLIRPYHPSDAPLVVAQANNPLVSAHLRDRFPSPYALSDAEYFLSRHAVKAPVVNFAVCLPDGTYAGGIGLLPGADVEAGTWELGYWLGEAFWGRGLGSAAVAAFACWAFGNYPDLRRLEGNVYSGNTASIRVLRKAGFKFEGVRRGAAVKRGVVRDILMHGLLKEECLGGDPSG